MAHEYQKRTRRRERNNNHLSNKKKGRKSVYTKNGSIYARLCYSSGFDASLSLSFTPAKRYIASIWPSLRIYKWRKRETAQKQAT